jgi:hypothetical protein
MNGRQVLQEGEDVSMRKFFPAMLAAAMACIIAYPARGADAENPRVIVDKAIKALGGQQNLGKIKAFTIKAKGKLNFGGMTTDFTVESTVAGLSHVRSTFSGEFSGNKFEIITVIDGDKGWRSFMGSVSELESDSLSNEKRNIYLQVIPMTILPLLGDHFKTEAAGEEKVNGKPALGIKIKPPDGKEFTLYFDRETGLPAKQVAKVVDLMGNEFTQEILYGGYKDLAGIKKATKNETKRDGESFLDAELTDFKVLDKVDPKTFSKPE